MKIIEFIEDELIFINLDIEKKEELFKKLSDNLYRNGYVKESFYKGVVRREEVFPTGLALEHYSVAIPHTDAEHVIKPCISIAILKKPIKFKRMEDDTLDVYVRIVFMLALKEARSQLEMLKQLMQIIQSKLILEKMLQVKSGKEIMEIIEKIS